MTVNPTHAVKSGVTTFDPDELSLSKQDILDTLDAIQHYWGRSPIKNARFITAIAMFKLGIKIQSKEEVEAIWNLCIKFIDQLRYKNALAKGESFSETLKKMRADFLTTPNSIAREIFGKK